MMVLEALKRRGRATFLKWERRASTTGSVEGSRRDCNEEILAIAMFLEKRVLRKGNGSRTFLAMGKYLWMIGLVNGQDEKR